MRSIQTRLVLFALCSACCVCAARADGPYKYNPEHRRPVDATLRDLQNIKARATPNVRDQERFDHAIHELRNFGQDLHEGGRFDKDELKKCVDEVSDVLEKNKMDQRGRILLKRDIEELTRLERYYANDYRYHSD